MEDILALVVVTLAVAIMAYVVYRIVKKNKQATAEYEARQAKAYEKLAEMRKETARKIKSYDTDRVTPRRASTTSIPASSSAVPATAAPVNNWSTDLLTTMIITDLLTNHKDSSAGTVSWKDDTPTYKETYSKPSTDFGFDDSDSRKSSSSAFSSSDSSSSWSDSSSSSSDSGPSSDW